MLLPIDLFGTSSHVSVVGGVFVSRPPVEEKLFLTFSMTETPRCFAFAAICRRV